HLAIALNFHQFVQHAKRRGINRRRKRRPYSERIHTSAGRKKGGDSFLVQITRKENFYVAPTCCIEPLTDPDTISNQISAIQTHTARLAADGDHLLNRTAHVI